MRATADLVPAAGAPFSVFLRVQGTPDATTYTEIISQGGGFYIGTAPGGAFRFGDSFMSTSVDYPSGPDFHDILLATDSPGTRVYIDGGEAFSSAAQIGVGSGGSFTRLDRQFDPHGEYFQGQIDELRIYDAALTPQDLAASPGVPEPASWALMLTGFLGAGGLLRRRRHDRGQAAKHSIQG
jgi:hypothetical protein